MSVLITVITTNASTHRFTLDATQGVVAMRQVLKWRTHLFSGKPLILSSSQQTELFAAESLVCIEIGWTASEETPELAALRPTSNQNPALHKQSPEDAGAAAAGGLDGEHYALRLDASFHGGHSMTFLAEGVRRTALAERLMNLNRLFEQPLLTYSLPGGGFGLMNPKTLLRVTTRPGIPDLPSDALPACAIAP